MIQNLLVILTLLVAVFVCTRKLVRTLKGKDNICSCGKDKCRCCCHCSKTFETRQSVYNKKEI